MREPLYERIRFWFCENILKHRFISDSWEYEGKQHSSCSVCKRIISKPLKED